MTGPEPSVQTRAGGLHGLLHNRYGRPSGTVYDEPGPPTRPGAGALTISDPAPKPVAREIAVTAAGKIRLPSVSGADNWAGEQSNFPGQRHPAGPILRILFGSDWQPGP